MPKGIKKSQLENIKPESKVQEENEEKPTTLEITPPKPITKWYVLLAILLLLGGLAYKNKSLFLAGMVGKTPIFKWQLNQVLEKKYGKQEFEGITTELLIQKEAESKKVSVSADEVKNEVARLEKTLNGRMSLDDALKAQGMTRDDFNGQVKVKLLVDKLLANETKVEDKEIDDFIAKNKDSITSSDTAQVREQVKDNLHQQKIAQQFEGWLNSIKQRITVLNFL